MLYRETGQFKTSYVADQAIFPIRQDRYLAAAALVLAYVAVPILGTRILAFDHHDPVPGLRARRHRAQHIDGLCRPAFARHRRFHGGRRLRDYKITTSFPGLNIIVVFVLAGVITALVGVMFGWPSLRIKGFYLAVATLASQFFLIWMFNKFPWFNNYTASGVISAPPRAVFGHFFVTGAEANPVDKYLFVLTMVVVMAFIAKNLVRGRVGRSWMAMRDMDIAAEIIGIRPLQTKLLAFAISSFYCGISGAMWAFIYTGGVEALAFDIDRSFQILFMIIIGGLGSILGSFLGAAFIVLLPIWLENVPRLLGVNIPVNYISNTQSMVFGALIVFFLIVEPRGLARLWQIGKEKLRTWPFPY